MTECEEVADTLPLPTSYEHAERIAAKHCKDQGSVIIANVAHALWLRARAKVETGA